MDAPSLAVCLVSPERDIGQSLVDLRSESLVVLDLAITPTDVHAIRIPFTPSVQNRVHPAPSIPILHSLWRSQGNTTIEGVCKQCESKAEKLEREPSPLDFRSDNDVISVSHGVARISFTIACPWFHLSPDIDEEPMLEVVLSHNDASQVLKIVNTLPYRFLIPGGRQGMGTVDPNSSSDAPLFKIPRGDLSADYNLEQLKNIPHTLEYFPNTATLLEQLGSNHLSLDESAKRAFESIASAKDLRRVISAQNKDGQTLAHLAARYKCGLLWKELMRSGIDLSVKDSNGYTASEYQNQGAGGMSYKTGTTRSAPFGPL